MQDIGNLALILVTTLVLAHVSRLLKMPAVIGELLAGILIGPALLGWISPTHTISLFAEIGVIILMFLAGLESDLELLKKYFKPGMLVAVIGVIVPVVVVFGFAHLWGFNLTSSLFLGITFAATSVSISVEVLKELHALEGRNGATILGAAVVDDILTVLILSFTVAVLGEQKTTSVPFWLQIIEQLLYFVGIYFVVRWAAPYLMRLSEKLFPASAVTIMSLLICLGMAYVADLVGMSAVIGAFFAGVAVGQTHYRHEVDGNLSAIGYAVFIPVFFVSVGLNMRFDTFGRDLGFIAILTVLALVTKWVGCGLGDRLAGASWLQSNVVGAGMVSRGEMALIVAQIGFEAKLMDAEYYSAVIVVIVITTLIAPVILKDALHREQELV